MSEQEIKYIVEQIKNAISSIENTFFQEYMNNQYSSIEEENPGYLKDWMENRISELYFLIISYLEAKGMVNYLRVFHEQFDSLFKDAKGNLLEEELYHPDMEAELKIIHDFRKALSPFKAFDYKLAAEEESIKLSSILRHTDFILKNVNATVADEADIYNQVKWVLSLYFPKCRLKNKASFIQQFKTYNPDILIPELKTAIEYKYIKDQNQNLDNYIDQIRTDANNYTDDVRYENFIAVIYIAYSGLATTDSIQVSWEQKKFPKNWELVIVIGSKQ